MPEMLRSPIELDSHGGARPSQPPRALQMQGRVLRSDLLSYDVGVSKALGGPFPKGPSRYRCAYCRRLLEAWERDHIIPRSGGGSHDAANLARACPRCNRFKSNKTHALDHFSARLVRLFDPYRDDWSEHFTSGTQARVPKGISDTGRATAALLFRVAAPNYIVRVASDLDLYDFVPEDVVLAIETARTLRYSNRFSEARRELIEARRLLQEYSPDPEDQGRRLTEGRIGLLDLEIAHSRGSRDYVINGLRQAEELGHYRRDDEPQYHSMVLNKHAILLEQRATRMWLTGHRNEARQLLTRAKATLAATDPEALYAHSYEAHTMRMAAYGLRASGGREPEVDISSELWERAHGELSWLRRCSDVIIYSDTTFGVAEPTLEALNQSVLDEGYGQDFDRLSAVISRRRWWLLGARLTGRIGDAALLETDIHHWREWECFNELSELAYGLGELSSRRGMLALAEAATFAARAAVGDD